LNPTAEPQLAPAAAAATGADRLCLDRYDARRRESAMRNRAALATGLVLAGLVGCASWNSRTNTPAVPALADARPSIGHPAPAITGTDIDGAPFALSDYAGKVVLLDFWGNW